MRKAWLTILPFASEVRPKGKPPDSISEFIENFWRNNVNVVAAPHTWCANSTLLFRNRSILLAFHRGGGLTKRRSLSVERSRSWTCACLQRRSGKDGHLPRNTVGSRKQRRAQFNSRPEGSTRRSRSNAALAPTVPGFRERRTADRSAESKRRSARTNSRSLRRIPPSAFSLHPQHEPRSRTGGGS